MAESYFWFRIFISSTLIGILFGVALYYLFPGLSGVILTIFSSIAGIFAGIKFANKMNRKYGAGRFISRIDSSHALDEPFQEMKKDKI